jgi:hypothetical protein
MVHNFMHTVHEDGFAIALMAMMVGVILWLPFMGILAMVVHGLSH